MIIGLVCLVCWGCENTTFQSSVPYAPVHVEINTESVFVDFLPGNYGTYITVNSEGYKENGVRKLPVTVQDAWGYGGIVTYISQIGYVAFDLACPYCAARGQKCPCTINGIYAVCPNCGEEYEVGSGYAVPTKGISKERLREMNVSQNGGRIVITQKK